MTFAQLVQLAERERDRVIDGIDFQGRGVPLKGKFGPSEQSKIIGHALYDHIVQTSNPIQHKGMVIGVSTATRGFANLRSTDNARFRELIDRLRRAVMSEFVATVMQRWERAKEKQGLLQPEASEADKFSNEVFTGFD